MKRNSAKIKEWIVGHKQWGYRFAAGVAVGCLTLVAHGHHFAERVIDLLFKTLVGATGTILAGIVVIAIIPIGWLYKQANSSGHRHAALRSNRRRTSLQRLALWVNARAQNAAFFISGIAFVALISGSVLDGFHIFTGALWFCALATFVESVVDGDHKFMRYPTGVSLGYLIGMTFAPHLHHL